MATEDIGFMVAAMQPFYLFIGLPRRLPHELAI
jgi:hypothetical protein